MPFHFSDSSKMELECLFCGRGTNTTQTSSSIMGAWLSKLTELFSSRKLELCLVGLENAGKTTLLNVLATGQTVETIPTVGLNVRMMTKGGVKMKGTWFHHQ